MLILFKHSYWAKKISPYTTNKTIRQVSRETGFCELLCIGLFTKDLHPHFPPQTLLPNSQDLNLPDYQAWASSKNVFISAAHATFDHLKERVLEEWNYVDQAFVDSAIIDNQ